MRERILIISNVTGGLVHFRLELIKKLTEEYDLFIIAEENLGREIIEQLGCRLIDIKVERHGTNPIMEYKLIRAYRSYIKEIQPKVVLTYTIKPNVYGGAICARLGIPYIANITGLGDAIENPGWLSQIARFMYKYGLRKARKVFFQNDANCGFFISHGLYAGDYEVLPGSGVNLEKHPFEPYPEETAKIVLSVVGRITKDKGIDEILEAANSFIGQNVVIRLIGDCEEDYLKRIKKAEEDAVIEYVGRQENIHEWYKKSHAILHASYHEGMSNVLLEAAASGRPVLASNVPGCMETFDDNISGLGFDPKNSNAIVKTIQRFLQMSYSEKAHMGEMGRKKIERSFNRDIIIRRYVETINTIGGQE